MNGPINYIVDETADVPEAWLFIDLTLLLMNKHGIKQFQICTPLNINCIEGLTSYLSDDGLVEVSPKGVMHRLVEMCGGMNNGIGRIHASIAGVDVNFDVEVHEDLGIIVKLA